MKNSLKQLFRTPGKTALFFLLMLAVTLLLVFSTRLLSETAQRIDEVERSFTTIGTVKQEPVTSGIPKNWYNICYGLIRAEEELWDQRVSVETLNAPGLNYLTPPEYRPYYLARHEDWGHSSSYFNSPHNSIIEFTALEDSDPYGAAHVRIDRVLLLGKVIGGELEPKEGLEILVCQCGGTRNFTSSLTPIQTGRRYIANVTQMGCGTSYHGLLSSNDFTVHEFQVMDAPYSTQCTADGERVKGEHFPYKEDGHPIRNRIEEITEGFYDEDGRGQDWLRWVDFYGQEQYLFPVMPTHSLQMIPAFQDHRAFLSDGREITSQEFESGARVCMIQKDTMLVNGWQVGDKISLPLQYTLYGQDATLMDGRYFFFSFSPLKADGQPYEIFWDAEYEIVGVYDLLSKVNVYNKADLYADTILIPKASVRASDADNIALYNYLDGKTATFQIPNGTIDEFDAALRAAVPEAESLVITYNDNGYTDIMKSLQSTRTTALLLFIVGLLAAVVIVLLLLYFFIVRERKRTAIERSLGMSKRQCRVSLLAGVLAVTVLAAGIGTAAGAVMMNAYHESAGQASALDDYDPSYSLWLKSKTAQEDMTKDFRAPGWLYGLVPLALIGAVGVLSLGMVNRNLKVEPIYLLSSKAE